MKAARPLAGRRIGIVGKGGAGKSTVSVLLAKTARRLGYSVCLLDADSTNVGLHLALGLKHCPAPLIKRFGGMVFSGGAVTCPVDDPTPLHDATIFLSELPTRYFGRTDDGINLLSAGKFQDEAPGAGCDGPMSKIARDLRVRGSGDPFVTFLDFKAGLEDTARGVITTLDWLLVVVDPTTAAVEMAANLKSVVDAIKAGRLPATKHLESPEQVEAANRLFRDTPLRGVCCVLNKVDRNGGFLLKELAARGPEVIGVIHADAAISYAWLCRTPLEVESTSKDVEQILTNLERLEQQSCSLKPENDTSSGRSLHVG